MAVGRRPWLDESTKSSVPLTADQLEMLDCGLSSLTRDTRWTPEQINEVSELLDDHRRYLLRLAEREAASS